MTRNELEGRTIRGVSGDTELAALGITERFSIGLNFVFLAAIFGILVVATYFTLMNTLSKAGLSKRKADRMRAKLLKKNK